MPELMRRIVVVILLPVELKTMVEKLASEEIVKLVTVPEPQMDAEVVFDIREVPLSEHQGEFQGATQYRKAAECGVFSKEHIIYFI